MLELDLKKTPLGMCHLDESVITDLTSLARVAKISRKFMPDLDVVDVPEEVNEDVPKDVDESFTTTTYTYT